MGPAWVMGISRLTLWLKKIRVIFLKMWGLLLILLVRSTPLQGGRGEPPSPSPPAPVGSGICNTFPSWAQHTQDLRRSHFQRNPRGKKGKINEKQKYPRYTSDRYCRPRPNRAFRLLSPISAHGLIQVERNRSLSEPKTCETNSEAAKYSLMSLDLLI